MPDEKPKAAPVAPRTGSQPYKFETAAFAGSDLVIYKCPVTITLTDGRTRQCDYGSPVYAKTVSHVKKFHGIAALNAAK